MSKSDRALRTDVDRKIAITERRTDHDGVAILAVSGDLDLLTAQALEDKLTEVRKPPNTAVVLDFSGVGFLGSIALSTLLTCAESAKSDGIAFALVATDRAVLRPLEVTGVRAAFDVFDSVDEALSNIT